MTQNNYEKTFKNLKAKCNMLKKTQYTCIYIVHCKHTLCLHTHKCKIVFVSILQYTTGA